MQERRDQIVVNMLIEDLTVPCMVSVARRSLVVLDMALKENGMRLQVP
jgi:hypothetical protein